MVIINPIEAQFLVKNNFTIGEQWSNSTTTMQPTTLYTQSTIEDETQQQSATNSDALAWPFLVAAVVYCLSAAAFYWWRRKRKRSNAQQAPPPQPEPYDAAEQIEVPGLVLSHAQSGSQIVGAGDDDDDNSEQKQGEEAIETQLTFTVDLKGKEQKEPFVFDPNMNYKREGSRASNLIPGNAAQHVAHNSDSEGLYVVNNDNGVATTTTDVIPPAPVRNSDDDDDDEDMYVVSEPQNTATTATAEAEATPHL